MTRPEHHQFTAPDASFFDVDPDTDLRAPRPPLDFAPDPFLHSAPRRWWRFDLATVAVIVSASFVAVMLAMIAANRFVF